MNLILIIFFILILIILFFLYNCFTNSSENTIERFENDNIAQVCAPPFKTIWGPGSPFTNSIGVYNNICSYVDKKSSVGIDVSNIPSTITQIPKIIPVSIAVPQKAAEQLAASPETQKQILESLSLFLTKKLNIIIIFQQVQKGLSLNFNNLTIQNVYLII